MLISNPPGNFHFTKGSPFYANAVVADPGFEVVRAVLERPLPLNAGFEAIRLELESHQRPLHALCGMELRTQDPYPDRTEFMKFNSKYVDRLRNLELLADGLVPVTRANLAVHDGSVTEQCVYAFLYTVPSKSNRLTFATSAYADLKRNADGSVQNVAADDVSPAGLREKVSFVMHTVDENLKAIGASWDLATHIRIYTVQPIGAFIPEVIFPVAGPAAHHGITWHYVYPPVVGLELEIDVRGVLQESVLLGERNHF
jgi:hypothetical protein